MLLSSLVQASDTPLAPEQATPLVALIDALAQAATASLALPLLPPPPPPVASPPPPCPLPPGVFALPPAPAAPELTEDEEDAAREEARKKVRESTTRPIISGAAHHLHRVTYCNLLCIFRILFPQDAEARNALADAVSSSLNGLGKALLNGAEADAPPIKLVAPSFTGVFAKQSITPDPTLPPPKLVAGAAPAALFVAAEDAEEALADGEADGFVVPSTLPALQVFF